MELEEDLDKQRLQINREIAALDRENEKWEKHLQTSTNPIAKEYLEIFIKSNKELRELKCTSIAKLEVIKSANEGRCILVLPPRSWQAATRWCLCEARYRTII